MRIESVAGLSLLVAGAVTLRLASAQAQMARLEDLAWMAGCWTSERGGTVVEEHWMRPAGGTILGMARTVRGSRTVEHEFLQIQEKDGKLAYVAKPSGQPEAAFTLRNVTEGDVVFENLTHDFPQRISYRRTAEGMTARIEGTRAGQARSVDYVYKRCP